MITKEIFFEMMRVAYRVYHKSSHDVLFGECKVFEMLDYFIYLMVGFDFDKHDMVTDFIMHENEVDDEKLNMLFDYLASSEETIKN